MIVFGLMRDNVKRLSPKCLSLKQLSVLLILWLLTMVSALNVIYVTHDTRLKYHELELLRRQENQLQIAWSQYLLEESTWAAYSRAEQIAKDDLNMQVPAANNIVVVSL